MGVEQLRCFGRQRTGLSAAIRLFMNLMTEFSGTLKRNISSRKVSPSFLSWRENC